MKMLGHLQKRTSDQYGFPPTMTIQNLLLTLLLFSSFHLPFLHLIFSFCCLSLLLLCLNKQVQFENWILFGLKGFTKQLWMKIFGIQQNNSSTIYAGVTLFGFSN